MNLTRFVLYFAILGGVLSSNPDLHAKDPAQTALNPVFITLAQQEAGTPGMVENNPPSVSIEVNIPATQMTVYENGIPIFTKPIAIGSGVYPTPVQQSSIKKIEWNPWWYPPPDAEWAAGEKPTPPGPGNPLGRAKMAISDTILFHGTNKESSVGRPASHGCMRMFNKDVDEIAWYLQTNFSDKNDPSFHELYQKNKRTTYVVQLNAEIPVSLIYKPLVVKDETLFLYPDFYRKLANRKKAAIIDELIKNGVNPESIDEFQVDILVKQWTTKPIEIPIETLTPPAYKVEPTSKENGR